MKAYALPWLVPPSCFFHCYLVFHPSLSCSLHWSMGCSCWRCTAACACALGITLPCPINPTPFPDCPSQAGSALLPVFVTVANGPVDKAVVAAGNEAVLRARFEDAAFFYREDLKQKLQEFR